MTETKKMRASQPKTRMKLPGRRVNRSRAGTFFIFVFLAAISIFMILPLYYSVITAFKPMGELVIFPPRFYVTSPTLDNFIHLFHIAQESFVPFFRYIFNSFLVAGLGTAAYVLIASMAAYPLAKHKFPGAVAYSQVVIWAILFRPEVMGIPRYIIISQLGIINTYLALILPVMAGSLGVFIMRQFMSTFPDDTLEAARIDGAGEHRILWQVVMPSVKPAWLTLIIFTFQSFWNDKPGVNYIFDEKLKLLPDFFSQISVVGIARAGAGAAVAVILLLPPIILFLMCQKGVLQTMAHSGMK